MYSKVNISENHLRILSLFTKSYNKEFYIRETSKKLKISTRTAYKILADMEKKGILNAKIRGKIKVYSINKKNPLALYYMILVESYKRLCFFRANYSFKQLLLDLSDLFGGGILLIFGSYAKNKQTANSDLDILAITDKKIEDEKLAKLVNRYTIRINIKYSSFDIDKNDFLIKEVLEDHICLKNTEDFLKLIW